MKQKIKAVCMASLFVLAIDTVCYVITTLYVLEILGLLATNLLMCLTLLCVTPVYLLLRDRFSGSALFRGTAILLQFLIALVDYPIVLLFAEDWSALSYFVLGGTSLGIIFAILSLELIVSICKPCRIH